ncbi:MAG: zinc-binding alcohol dehydrogenase [Chloroflexi bacterium]|nr:zinc-binding alcohol dehydrogenase [Chloroflexota bacterium]MBV9601216.1 zinc-binding alcohol dehydrogenase [Chloroflexota bacterium]
MGKIRIESFELPLPGPRDVLVRTRLTQVSAGTEVNAIRARRSGARLGELDDLPLGYTSVGVVEVVGPEVAGLAPGDRVLGSGPHASHWLVTPAAREGEQGLLRVPEEVDDASAAFAILGDVALHAIHRARIAIGESVAVHGQGVVGLIALRLARLSGAHPLIGVDIVDERLRVSKLYGASGVVNATTEDVAAAIHAATPVPRRFDGAAAAGLEPTSGADVQIHATSRIDVVPAIVRAAADRGRIVIAGATAAWPDPGPTIPLSLDVLLRREISVVGSYETGVAVSHPYWPWTRSRNRATIIDLIRRGELDVRPLISHVVPFRDAPAVYDMLTAGGEGWLSVAFTWTD